MSIRLGMLALLADGPSYGYQLRSEFEERTGGTWPLNIGQVYTTLSRLERDGLIEEQEVDADDRQVWRLTEQGRTELESWFRTPVSAQGRPRDELAIKLALAATTPGIDATQVLHAQRIETLRNLQHYTRLKQSSDANDLAWSLVLDGLIFQAEAESRWLDHCEGRITSHKRKTTRSKSASTKTEKRAKGATQ